MNIIWFILFATASAVPEFKRAVCNADDCLRAVRASSDSPFGAAARSDCSSFVLTTVTPIPVTSTFTTTTVVTASKVTSTLTTTSIISKTAVVSSQTIVVKTITEKETVISTSTTYTSTSTSNGDFTGAPTANGKRDRTGFETPHQVGQLRARRPASTSESPRNLPYHATACSDSSRYASACSCIGITSSVTMLAPRTTILTSTATSTSTPVRYVTVTEREVSTMSTTTKTVTSKQSSTTVTTVTGATIIAATKVVSNKCTNLFRCGDATHTTSDCGLSLICTCFKTSDTEGYCSSAINSNGSCGSTSDCPEGNVCVFNTCAGNACIPTNDQACESPVGPAAARRLFRRYSEQRSVWSDLRGKYVML